MSKNKFHLHMKTMQRARKKEKYRTKKVYQRVTKTAFFYSHIAALTALCIHGTTAKWVIENSLKIKRFSFTNCSLFPLKLKRKKRMKQNSFVYNSPLSEGNENKQMKKVQKRHNADILLIDILHSQSRLWFLSSKPPAASNKITARITRKTATLWMSAVGVNNKRVVASFTLTF